jgi:CelD/BcsL family acetyltransferase involved in cellulose biosynthesis
MAKPTSDLNFIAVDTEQLPTSVKPLWAKLKKAEAELKHAREDFEGAFTTIARKAEQLPEGLILRFGYRYGGLAVATVDQSEARKPTKPKFVLGK